MLKQTNLFYLTYVKQGMYCKPSSPPSHAYRCVLLRFFSPEDWRNVEMQLVIFFEPDAIGDWRNIKMQKDKL